MAAIKKGDVFETNFSGPAKVINYFNARHVVVEFLVTGRRKRVYSWTLRSGGVRDKNTAEIIVKRVKLMAENEEFTPGSPKAVFMRTQQAWINQGEL